MVQNTGRKPIEIIVSKSKSVFTYEGQLHNIIKVWDINTLRVYQKINLNIEVSEMKVSNEGLYLISS